MCHIAAVSSKVNFEAKDTSIDMYKSRFAIFFITTNTNSVEKVLCIALCSFGECTVLIETSVEYSLIVYDFMNS